MHGGEKTFSMKEDFIVNVAPSFIRESANKAAKHINSGKSLVPPRDSSLKRSGEYQERIKGTEGIPRTHPIS